MFLFLLVVFHEGHLLPNYDQLADVAIISGSKIRS